MVSIKAWGTSMNHSSKVFRCALLCLLVAAPVCEAEEHHENSGKCTGVAEWMRTHPDETAVAMARRDAARTLVDPSLRSELEQRVARDQKARMKWLAAPGDHAAGLAVDAVDADNLAWLRALIRDQGFPTAQQVGEGGLQDAWLLLQHADRDPQLQEDVLPTLVKRHAEGELSANDLARTTDRVLLAKRQPQRYGTQFPAKAWQSNHFDVPEGQSVSEIDAHRHELGLMPLADYACMMNNARKGR